MNLVNELTMVRRCRTRQLYWCFFRHFIDIPCPGIRYWGVFLSVGTNAGFFLLKGKTFFYSQ